jgi:two-component system sensor histidine kinase PilS (NtrC family)
MKGQLDIKIAQFPWRVLQIFGIYRLVIVGTLFGYFFFVHNVSESWGQLLFIISYLIFALACIFIVYRKQSDFNKTCILQLLIDIFFLSVLLYVNPTLINLYGILINATIAGGSIVTGGRVSLFFAAFASICVLLAHAIFAPHPVFFRYYTEAGIWGVTFFATALLAYGLSQRARGTETLARQQGEAIAKLEKLSDVILQRMNSGVIVVDDNERIQLINKAAWFLLGLPERQGPIMLSEVSPVIATQLQIWRLQPYEDVQMNENLVNKGLLVNFTSLNHHPSLHKVTLIFLEDSARLAEQAQQDKLASLGRLTASIAHEIRNPLSSISHAAQLMNEEKKISPEDHRLLEIIQANAHRMNSIIENILQLTRRKQAIPLLFKVKPWIDNIVRELQFAQQDIIKIDVQITPPDLEFYADMTQLQQVMFNLCENGLRFSKQKTGNATLTIHAGITEQGVLPFIEVIDYGPGIDRNVEQYIFEPFYTTKKGGTGLGLYVARELCEANHARLVYYPPAQGGACFRITFSHLSKG